MLPSDPQFQTTKTPSNRNGIIILAVQAAPAEEALGRRGSYSAGAPRAPRALQPGEPRPQVLGDPGLASRRPRSGNLRAAALRVLAHAAFKIFPAQA